MLFGTGKLIILAANIYTKGCKITKHANNVNYNKT